MSYLNVNIKEGTKIFTGGKESQTFSGHSPFCPGGGARLQTLHMQNEKEGLVSLNSRSFKIVIKSTKHQQS